MTSKQQPAWTGMVSIDDTALAVTDTGGPGRPVVYLNGSYADQSHWRRVITNLGSNYRHITYDERARGKSKRATDYSFEACLRDLDAVLTARNVDRPILVGWSYGAMLAMHWASRNPHCALGGGIRGRRPAARVARRRQPGTDPQAVPPAEPVVPDRPPARPGRANERRATRRDQHRGQRALRARRPQPGLRPSDRTDPVRARHRRQPGRRPEADGTDPREPRPGARP
ncbi:alpha/beta fold hydrolase [Streptomyces sp. NPDC055287]